MIYDIHVTEEDIEKGFPISAMGCPIALSLDRTIPEYRWAVGSTRAYGHGRVSWEVHAVIELPEEAKEFVDTTRHSIPSPITFRAEVTDPYW